MRHRTWITGFVLACASDGADASTSVRVQVLDAEGRRAAGIPVVLALDRDGLRQPHGRATSGPDGVAHVECDGEGAILGPAHVRAEVPLPPASWVPVDLSAPEPHLVELRLPHVGSVVVEAHDEAARVAEIGGTASLRVIGSSELGDELEMPVNRGVARFPFVAHDVRFEVSLKLDDRQSVTTERAILSDVAPAITLSVVAPEPGPRIRGTILDAAGAAVAGAIVRTEIHSSSGCLGYEQTLEFVTDSRGAFDVDASSVDRGDRNQVTFWFTSSGGKPIGRIDSTLPIEFEPVFELGTLQLGRCRAWCAGSVVDDLGRPIVGARITVASRTEEARSEQELASIERAAAITDARGAFDLAGEGDAHALGLFVANARELRFSEPSQLMSFEMGDVGVRVVVERRSGIHGRVLLDREGAGAEISVKLETTNCLTSLEVDSNGSFDAHSLDSGTWSASVVVGHTLPWLVATSIADIHLKPGRPVDDPRLESIDLRGRIHRAELHVHDESGAPVQHAHVVQPGGEDRPCRQLGWVKDGAATIDLLDSMDLEIRCRGYRTQPVRDAKGIVDVTMPPGLPIRIRLLAEECPLHVARVLLQPAPGDDWGGEGGEASICGGLSDAMRVGRTGSFSVTIHLAEQLRETLPGGTAFIHPIELSFLPTSPKIEVADVQSEQEFDVRLDDETILRTLEAVEQARRDGFLIE